MGVDWMRSDRRVPPLVACSLVALVRAAYATERINPYGSKLEMPEPL